WRAGLRTYSQLVYEELWPGIDLVYSGTGSQLKYEFRVKPGADPSRIRLAYRGATEVKVDEAGRLEVRSGGASMTDERPFSYQEQSGRRVEVESAFTLSGAGYGFRLGAYDRTRELVIDPATLVYCGFIGGAG